MLDAVVAYLPSPLDVPPVTGIDPRTDQTRRGPPRHRTVFGLAFKIVSDPFVGRLAYVRVYSGTLSSGSYVLNTTQGQRERIARLLRMHANKREEVAECWRRRYRRGGGSEEYLHWRYAVRVDQSDHSRKYSVSRTGYLVSIEPKTKADQDKMGIALSRLSEEDPTFRMHTDDETGQTIIPGMGELHLEVIVDRMLREFKVEANVGRPQVAYRETITQAVEAEGRFVRQSGGRGQYGDCWIRVEPLDRAGASSSSNKVVGGADSEGVHSGDRRRHSRGHGKWRRRRISDGRSPGHRCLTGRFTLSTRAKWRSRSPARWGSRRPTAKARPVLLEPIMRVEVTVPGRLYG